MSRFIGNRIGIKNDFERRERDSRRQRVVGAHSEFPVSIGGAGIQGSPHLIIKKREQILIPIGGLLNEAAPAFNLLRTQGFWSIDRNPCIFLDAIH